MLRGSCLCGAVKYEIRGAPRGMYHCHCGMCRKANGSSLATNLIVPAAEFEVVTGRERLSAYESSPGKQRWFCSGCGSPIYSQSGETRGIVSVRGGTVDGDPGIRPSVHVWAAARAPWTEICDGLPQRPAG
jgi:hypothetical protein